MPVGPKGPRPGPGRKVTGGGSINNDFFGLLARFDKTEGKKWVKATDFFKHYSPSTDVRDLFNMDTLQHEEDFSIKSPSTAKRELRRRSSIKSPLRKAPTVDHQISLPTEDPE